MEKKRTIDSMVRSYKIELEGKIEHLTGKKIHCYITVNEITEGRKESRITRIK